MILDVIQVSYLSRQINQYDYAHFIHKGIETQMK